MFDPVRIGFLEEPTFPYAEVGSSNIVRGFVDSSAGRQETIVKQVEPHQLAREILCSLLASAIEVPVPEGFIVDISQTAWGVNVGQKYAFGSSYVGNSRISRSTRSSPATAAALAKWPKLELAVGFDELVANNDRQYENILLVERDRFYLIDHAEVLPNHMTTPDHKIPNAFARHLVHARPGDSPSALVARVEHACQKFGSIDFAELKRAGSVQPLNSEGYFDACVDLVMERLNHFNSLLHEEFRTGQGHLILGER